MYVLIIVYFSGAIQTKAYDTEAFCKKVLLSSIDNGWYKKMKTAECIPLDQGD